MRTHWMIGLVVAALAFGVVAGRVTAEEEGEGGMPPPPQKGEQHKMLAKVAGEWDANTKFWLAPGQPPMESKDECTCKLILNDWFMEMDYRGKMPTGGTWSGRLTAGYDQTRKEHIHIWITDHSGDVSVERGQMNDKGVLVMHGDHRDPMKGTLRPTETTFEWPDDNTIIMTMYWCNAEKSREGKMLEITYKRKQDSGGMK